MLHMCTRQTCLQLICGAGFCFSSVQTAGLINLFHLCDAIEWVHEHVAQLHSMLECELHVSYLRSQPMHTLIRCVHNIFIAAAIHMHRNSCALFRHQRTQMRLDSFSLSLCVAKNVEHCRYFRFPRMRVVVVIGDDTLTSNYK